MNNGKNNYKINVGIIAAGEGLRLKKEGIKISKPLIKINGIPMIQRIITIAYKYGVSSITCIVNEESKALKKYLLDNYSTQSFNLIVKSTPSSLHSLHQLSRFLKPPFLLTTTDSIFKEEEFTTFLNYGMSMNDADGIIAVTDLIDDENPLYADVDENGWIRNFEDEDNDYEFVTGGLYLFKTDLQNEIDESVKSGVVRLRNFLRFLVKKDYRFYAFPFSKIIDVDHVSDIKIAKEFLSDHSAKNQERK